MRAAGVEVEDGVLAEEAEAINETWTFAVRQQRPFVTWKFAATLDGRSAAADGTARWITGPEARADVHRLRASCDTVLVGTGTVEADNPRLTVRDEHDRPKPPRPAPLRVVMGTAELDPDSRVFDASARTVRAADARPAARAGGPVRRRAAARVPRGRPDARGGVPQCRPGRRGDRLRRAGPARQRIARRSATSASDRWSRSGGSGWSRRRRSATTSGSRSGRAPPRGHLSSWRRADVHRDRRGARRGRRDRSSRRLRPALRPRAEVVSDAGHGDSIAVNGCCLTVVDVGRRAVHRRRDGREPRPDLARRACGPAAGSTSSAP